MFSLFYSCTFPVPSLCFSVCKKSFAIRSSNDDVNDFGGEMKKLIGIKILAAILIIFTLTSDSLAQTRITFAAGKTSKSLTDTMTAGGSHAYVLRVKRNQKMTISVVSSNRIQIDVDDVDGHIEYGDGYSQIITTNNGDHWITLRNQGSGSTRYTMTVSVR
jgi:hypothetical protein